MLRISIHLCESASNSLVMTHCFEFRLLMESYLFKLSLWFFAEKLFILFINIYFYFWFCISKLVSFFSILIFSICLCRLSFIISSLIPCWFYFDWFIVTASFLLIGQHLISFLNFLKPVFISTLVNIGVVQFC